LKKSTKKPLLRFAPVWHRPPSHQKNQGFCVSCYVTPKPKKKKELLFVNKKKQKNFNHFWPVALERLREAEQKFFGSFFQKRTPCF
jgi:hypothetical protein